MLIKLIDFGAVNEMRRPCRAHYNDAGADVFVQDMTVLSPHETRTIPLGFGVELPDGFMALVLPRSGLSKKGITCEIPPIDSGYRGQIHAFVTNNSDRKHIFMPHDRIGQLVVIPIILADFIPEDEFAYEERGTGAFASTGR